MDLRLETLSRVSATDRTLCRPEFFRLSLPADRERLHELLKRVPTLVVHDELPSQLAELVRALHPSVKFTKIELAAAAKAHLGAIQDQDYGVWVYYPWAGRLVHLLDEAEFALVRTDRNRNKITREEQERLGRLRIGVVGLSVGQSICLTLALERGFGELRIADFDTLDLSNLNRIRSGVHSLGNLKTVNVAREIAELDPFLKVTVFSEGLSRENVDAFLLDGGKLDMLVDECDSVDVKILCRQRAKAQRIPVIMDTSDRGMLDVERFDLEPERPILHGLIDHLNPDDAAKARTNEEKLPFVLPIAGMETLSPRMKASMLEIESSVTTWPQLASSVMLGGAVGAEFCRRIALDQTRVSGRWYLEPEKITGETVGAEQLGTEPISPLYDPLSFEDMLRTANLVTKSSSAMGYDEAEARRLAEAGALAPSAGNAQPWKFLHSEGRFFIFSDSGRGASRLDGGGLLPAIGLGACIENIRIASLAQGIDPEILLLPVADAPSLVAVILPRSRGTGVEPDALAPSIPHRCTNRKKPSGAPIAQNVLEELARAGSSINGCVLHFATTQEQLDPLAEAISEAERLRVLNPIGHEELFAHEIRWTRQQAASTGDGLDLETMELRPSERAAFQLAADAATISLLREWGAGRGFKRMTRDAVRTSNAVCLVSTADDRPATRLSAGRAVERLWLAATAHGLAVHPVSAPILLAHHVRQGKGTGMSTWERSAVIDTLNEVCRAFALTNREPMFMVRLAHAEPPSVRSLRRPLDTVLFFNQTVTA